MHGKMYFKGNTMRKAPMWLVLIVLFMMKNAPAASTADTAGKEFYHELHEQAKFRLFVPEDVTFIRGVICASDYHSGTHIYGTKPGYRELAKDLDFALFKYYLGEIREMCSKERYDDMIAALDYFADKTGYNELKYAKLALTGFSFSSRQATLFAMYNPSRCIAIIAIHGAFNKKYGGLLPVNSAVRHIPGIFAIAGVDNSVKDSAYYQVIKERKKGALWGVYIDPGSRHPTLHRQQLNIMWLKAVVNKRLPEHIPKNNDFSLCNIPKEDCWLGCLEYKPVGRKFIVTKAEIYPYKEYPYDRAKAQWLPGREVAEAWLERNKNAAFKKKSMKKTSVSTHPCLNPRRTD